MSIVIRAVAIVSVLIGLPVFVHSQDGAVSNLAQQCQAICQDKTAAWRTVAWQTDLLDAQKVAVEKQKPLFIWAMDGHPLGCT
jgi:hypothetical protein